jgi:predicted metal-dependent peptidase
MNTFGIARSKLILEQPFFGTLALYLTPVQDQAIPTAATDGTKLFYNPAWFDEIKEKDGITAVMGIIAHEVMHCALSHLWRRGARDKTLWNIAADYAVNLIVKGSGLKLPDGALIDTAFKDKTAEDIYALLQKNQNKKNGLSGLVTLDDHSMWGNSSESEEPADGLGNAQDSIAEQWKNYAISAAQAAKSQGKLPAALERLVEKLAQPQIPYKQILAEYMQRINNEYSWGPFDRRFIYGGGYLPSTGQDGFNEIVVAIDTSGSISQKEISQFLAEVFSISSIGSNTIHIVFCDAEIHGWYTASRGEDMPEVKVTGGGDTSFVPVFNEISVRCIEPAVLVYLTDGYGPYPKKQPDYPVLWVMTRNHQEPPWGRTILLDC